jgi:hypothetical protein
MEYDADPEIPTVLRWGWGGGNKVRKVLMKVLHFYHLLSIIVQRECKL